MLKHIFMIICDELRSDTLGYSGDFCVKTPNIDNLAKDSINFQNCYCDTPMCIPSRVSIATGRYALSHGALDNMFAPFDNEKSLYETLVHNGYRTVNHGKWHTNKPTKDFGIQSHDSGDGSLNDIEKNVTPFGIRTPKAREGSSYTRNYGEVPLVLYGNRSNHKDSTRDAVVTQNFLKELKEIAKSDTPTFARLSILDPHSPYMPASPFDTMYNFDEMEIPENYSEDLSNKPLLHRYFHKARGFDRLEKEDYKKMKSCYYGLVSHVDEHIGKVVSTLKDLNLYDDSLIIFTSDHGCMLGEHGFIEKWGHMYEPVVRCPLLVKMPNQNLAGNVISSFVELVDLMPTILDLNNIDIPKEVQGKSLKPVLLGETTHHKDRVFSQYTCGSIQDEPAIMVRDKDWKLTVYPKQDKVEGNLYNDHPLKMSDFFDSPLIGGELYDMANDREENVNLFENPEYSNIKEKYITYIEEFKKSLNVVAKIPSEEKKYPVGLVQLMQGRAFQKVAKNFSENKDSLKCEI